MSWLSNKQISLKVRKNGDEIIRKAFYGVYPIDELPEFIPHLPIFIVVNTQTHNLEGEHWKTIFIDAKRCGEVFDSLAQPMNDLLIRWMNRFTRKWKTNHKVYQHSKSTQCGAFALYFILKRMNYSSLNTFTQTFSPSFPTNESLVRDFYEKLK
jgi:ribosomal protein S17E